MKFLRNPSTDPFFNMSFDEWCLGNIESEDDFFYLWRNRPSVIIGFNQDPRAEVNLRFLEERGIDLVRRITGGGAVYHDLSNINYTIIGRKPSPEPILEALRSFGLDARMTGRNDIFIDGRKVSGYARRVSPHRELIHGTLMYDVDLDTLARALDTPQSKLHLKGVASVPSRVANLKDMLPRFADVDEFQEALQVFLADGDEEIAISPEDLDLIRQLSETKFSTPQWVYRGSLSESQTQ